MDLLTAPASALLAASDAVWVAGLGPTRAARRLTVRRLAQRWHPDHCAAPEAGAVFARLQEIRRRAATDDRAAPRGAARSVFESGPSPEGKRWTMPYAVKETTELGTLYIGRATILEAMDLGNADLAERAAAQTARFSFASKDMEAQMVPCLPRPATVHRTATAVLVVRPRDPNLVRLADLTAHGTRTASAGGGAGTPLLPPEHVAWIGSGLWNLACYLEHTNRAHPAINASTVWVDTARHRVALLGGWSYAGTVGEKWVALPAAALADAPPAWRDTPVHRTALGAIQIRRLLRDLLGDPAGMGPLPSGVPAPLAVFARAPAAGSAREQYRSWKETLVAAFGPPKFVPWTLPSTTNLYTTEEN